MMKLISVRNKLSKQIAIYVYLSSSHTVFNINLEHPSLELLALSIILEIEVGISPILDI